MCSFVTLSNVLSCVSQARDELSAARAATEANITELIQDTDNMKEELRRTNKRCVLWLLCGCVVIVRLVVGYCTVIVRLLYGYCAVIVELC